MPLHKDITPEELAALVKRKMIESAPGVDLYQYLDLDAMEQEIVTHLKRTRPLIKRADHE